MPRIKRLIPQEGALHVMCRGNNKQVVFNCDSDKLRYYALMRELKDENQVSIIHYCLMNNHVHLVFLLNSLSRISRFMKQLNLSYFIYYKNVYGYVGHLFQGRFKSKIIETSHYLLQCGKYVELNPVRGGLARLPQEYRFSSYNYYVKGKLDSLLTDDPLYLELSDSVEGRRRKYSEFVVDNNIMKGKEPFIGSKAFVDRLKEEYGLNGRRKRGRPKKIGDGSHFSKGEIPAQK
jgi:putative transposase